MKIIAIGDTHGRNNWEKIVEIEKDADKIVLVGDYFDTHENTTGAEQIANFIKLTEYKKEHPDQLVLLMGNHELHYMLFNEQYSGFQPALSDRFGMLIDEALKENWMQLCFMADNILFSHAGFTDTWVKANDVPLDGIQEFVNKLPLQLFKYNRIDRSGYGEHVAQGPLWVRPNALMSDPVTAYRQVVGHTTMNQIQILNPVCFIDTIGVSGQYLKLTDGELSVCS